MTFLTLPENQGERTSFISVEAKHVKPVKAGDRLDIKSSLSSFRADWLVEKSYNGGVCLEVKFLVAIPSVMKRFLPQEN